MGKGKPGQPKALKSKRTGSYFYETHDLTDWFRGAAHHELRHAAETAKLAARGSDPRGFDSRSPIVVHRIAAVMFAATAIEARLANMLDLAFMGHDTGFPTSDPAGALRPAIALLEKAGRWAQRVNLIAALWSPGCAYVLDPACGVLKRAQALVDLRNSLVHAKPRKENVTGDKETALYHGWSRSRLRFSDADAASDLPRGRLTELSHDAVTGHLKAMDDLIDRLEGMAELTTERNIVLALDDDGSVSYRVRAGRPNSWGQVRWCEKKRKYVEHRYRAKEHDRDDLDSPVALEDTRECTVMEECNRAEYCDWKPIKLAAKKRAEELRRQQDW